MRLLTLLLFLAACGGNGGFVEPPPDDRSPEWGQFVSAYHGWSWETVLITEVTNTGERHGGYRLEIWSELPSGGRLYRETPTRGLHPGLTGSVHWLIIRGDSATVKRVLLWSTSYPEPWILTDSLSEGEIGP